MIDLTEQWKKGELPSGRYWVKMSYQGAIIPLYYSEDYGFEYDDHFFDFEEVSEILAEVPSYEELQNMNEAVNQAMSANIKLVEQNAQLKELLEECRHIIGIEKDFATCHFEEYTLVELLTKIDEALR